MALTRKEPSTACTFLHRNIVAAELALLLESILLHGLSCFITNPRL